MQKQQVKKKTQRIRRRYIFSVNHTHKILRHYLYRINRTSAEERKKHTERKSNLGKFTSLWLNQNKFRSMFDVWLNRKRDRFFFGCFFFFTLCPRLLALSFSIVIIISMYHLAVNGILCLDHRFNSLKFLFMIRLELHGRWYTKSVFRIKFSRYQTYWSVLLVAKG